MASAKRKTASGWQYVARGAQGLPGITIVNHGTNASYARPVDAVVVYWVGTADPVNSLDTDFWLEA